MKCAYTVSTFFTKLILFVHKVPFIINTQSLVLLKTLYVGGRKLSVEGSEFFIPFVSALYSLIKGVPEIHPTEGQKVEAEGC